MKNYKKGETVWVYDSNSDSVHTQVLYDDENYCVDTGERFVQISSWQIKDVQFVARSRKALLRKLSLWFRCHTEKQEKASQKTKAEIDKVLQETKNKYHTLITNSYEKLPQIYI